MMWTTRISEDSLAALHVFWPMYKRRNRPALAREGEYVSFLDVVHMHDLLLFPKGTNINIQASYRYAVFSAFAVYGFGPSSCWQQPANFNISSV